MVPSVVHWKVGHYAAMVRQEGDRYQLQDPTFGNDPWATEEALEAETSGYFLRSAGRATARGWRRWMPRRRARRFGAKGNTGATTALRSRRQRTDGKSLQGRPTMPGGMAVVSSSSILDGAI